MTDLKVLLTSLSLLSTLSVVGCDDGAGMEDDGVCAEMGPGGKADDGSSVAGEEGEVVLLTREGEGGVPQVVALEGVDAAAFEELSLQPDLTEGDIDAFLEVIGASPDGDEAEVDGDVDVHRNLGFCFPLVNRHTRQMHVGWTDNALIGRAPSTPTQQAGSWNTETAAYAAIKAVLDQTCLDILAWQATAPVGANIVRAAYTGIPGRVCFWNADCIDAMAAEVVYRKTTQVVGWHAGKIVTAYPKPF